MIMIKPITERALDNFELMNRVRNIIEAGCCNIEIRRSENGQWHISYEPLWILLENGWRANVIDGGEAILFNQPEENINLEVGHDDWCVLSERMRT